jgi:thiamine-phosphate pyrophosphorylase
MTDPRLDDRLLAAIRKLPQGSGVIFRHYGLPADQRRLLFAKVRHVCRQRGHRLLLADDAATARRWGADGVHRRGRSHGAALHSAPVHDVLEIGEALRTGATLLFLSPLRATRSHPGQRPLGPTRFAMLARLCRPAKVIALGGMNRAHVGKWSHSIVHGWAAIDAF